MKINITGNGSYRLNGKHSMGSSIIYMGGVAGGATVAIHGFGGPLIDGAVDIGSQYQVRHGRDADIFAVVSGAGGSTDIAIKVAGLE